MTAARIDGATRVAGVVGRPIGHSLSPLLHNAWIEAAGLNAVYAPFSPPADRILAFFEGLRGGTVVGLNVTLPFKEAALQVADRATEAASAAGAANLLLFAADGGVEADNTDGQGLLYALRRGDPGLDPTRAPIAILGAGGAARGALAALTGLGAQDLRVINRTPARAERLAAEFPSTRAFALDKASEGLADAALVINAASAEVDGEPITLDFSTAAPGACAMDMLYRPLATGFLRAAAQAGLRRIDGLDMLIGQALPSFERLFGRAAPSGVDARGLALRALGETS